MRRAGATLALAFAAVTPSALWAQAANPVSQAVSDTATANIKRSYPLASPSEVRTTLDWMQEALQDAVQSGGNPLGPRTWAAALQGLQDYIRAPFDVGQPGCKWTANNFCGQGGGSEGWYGGGSNGSWGEADVVRSADMTGKIDCGDVKYSLDAQGNLIIPAMPLATGGPINEWRTGPTGGKTYYVVGSTPGDGSTSYVLATSYAAAMLRSMHERNLHRLPSQWYGALGYNAAGEVQFASVASRDPVSGVVTGRETTWRSPTDNGSIYYLKGSAPQLKCPEGSGGGSFDFYVHSGAPGSSTLDVNECIMYSPNSQLGFQGYAMNSQTSIPYWQVAQFPKDIPEILKKCPLDPGFIQKLTDAIKKKACAKPGYTGKACTAVTPEDVKDRPKVGDLTNDPCAGANGSNPTSCSIPSPAATPVPPVPSPTPTSTPVASGPMDPGTYPTNTAGDPPEPQALPMDPVFNWFPSISSIHLDVGSAGCPTWHMEPFGWSLTMDSHCAFIQQNQTLISVIMIVGFGIGAAMIILRA